MALKVQVVNDLGNGYVKAVINGQFVKFPSVVVKQREQDMFDPIKFKNKTDEEHYLQFLNLLQNLDVTIQSPTVKNTDRLFVGESAVRSHLPITSFDVNDLAGKSETDLALQITLSMISCYVLSELYDTKIGLKSEYDADVVMMTALPIVEGKRNQTIDRYRERYLKQDHIITFKNFDSLVSVKLHFTDVQVSLEGESAQYALMLASGGLKDAINADFTKHYPNLTGDVTIKTLLSAENTMGIDIGEGTTDLPVFNDSKLNAQASSSLNLGYGNALEEALSDLKTRMVNFNSRAELQSFIDQKTTGLIKRRQSTAREAVSLQMEDLAQQITSSVSQTLRHNASGVDLVFVYGGGASPLEPYLRYRLQEKTKAFVPTGIPVIFIDAKYAQYLNEMGLKLMLTTINEA